MSCDGSGPSRLNAFGYVIGIDSSTTGCKAIVCITLLDGVFASEKANSGETGY